MNKVLKTLEEKTINSNVNSNKILVNLEGVNTHAHTSILEKIKCYKNIKMQ